jgi:hypothetical protein
MTTTDSTKAPTIAPVKAAPKRTAPAVAKKAAGKTVTTKSASKAAPQSAKKLAAKPAAKVPTKPTKAAAKPAKVKKPKIVRDSFTMPKAEFVVIDALKTRATQLKTAAKKTELIRAGIKALAAMSDSAFLAAIAAVPNLKTGRPAKS